MISSVLRYERSSTSFERWVGTTTISLKRELISQPGPSSDPSCSIVDQALRLAAPCYSLQQGSQLADANWTAGPICYLAPSKSSDTPYETIAPPEAQYHNSGQICAIKMFGKQTSNRSPQSETHFPMTSSLNTFQYNANHSGAGHWNYQKSLSVQDFCVAFARHQNQNYCNEQHLHY